MTRHQPGVSQNQIVAALQAAARADTPAPPVPEDAYTVRELVELTGIGRWRLSNLLPRLLEQGTVELASKPVQDVRGVWRATPAYRFVGEADGEPGPGSLAGE